MILTPETKKLVLFLGGIAAFAALLVVGADIFLRFVPTEQPAGAALPPVEQSPSAPHAPGASEPGRISKPGLRDNRPIIYTDAGFQPQEITVKRGDSLGCLISVTNASSQTVRVGVNPHASTGDPGANYDTLAPGEMGIYDVRYPGMSAITLHNHLNPAHEFRVIYGEGCK